MDILIIEDSASDARLIREALGEIPALAAEVTHVSRLSEATARLAAPIPQPDLILLDLGLPDAAGLEALEQVVRVAPTLPVVVLTGRDDEAGAVQALREGAQDYLLKHELQPSALGRAIRYAIERKRMQGREHLLVEVGSVLTASIDFAEALEGEPEPAEGPPAGQPAGEAHDFEKTLMAVAALALVHLRCWCIVDVVEADGAMRRLGIIHPDAIQRESVARLIASWPPLRGDLLGAPRAIDSRETESIPRVSTEALAGLARTEANLRDLRSLGVGSVVVAPLIARGHVLAAFSLIRSIEAAAFSDAEVQLARDLAARCAIGLDGARLFREAKTARIEAEKARNRAAILNGQLVITSLNQQELAEEAWDANQAKSRFLATMSHEIRTPLNAIVGYTELIEMGIAGPLTPMQRGYLGRLKASSSHLLGLIDNILDLSKLESGRLLVRQETGIAQQTIAAATYMIEPQAVAAGVEVTTAFPDVPSNYAGDEDRVRQVLVILFSNALKFTDSGGRITVSCGTVRSSEGEARLVGEGPWTFLRVQDTGIGISADQAKTVFDAFVQVDPGNTRQQGGAGLGLAIGIELARRMGGDLTLKSVLGEGSCFTLWLPSALPATAKLDTALHLAGNGVPAGGTGAFPTLHR